ESGEVAAGRYPLASAEYCTALTPAGLRTWSLLRGRCIFGKWSSSSGLRPRAYHEAVVAELSDLPPQIRIVAECHDGIPYFLVVRIGRGRLTVHLLGCLQAGF